VFDRIEHAGVHGPKWEFLHEDYREPFLTFADVLIERDNQ